MKTWDKPGFLPYFTQWKLGKPRFVPGTIPGRRAAQKVYVKKSLCAFSLAKLGIRLPLARLAISIPSTEVPNA